MANLATIAAELKKLEKDDGRLRPEDVVEQARDPKSPLHDQFEWDDSEAARLHRLGQARQLIGRVKMEYVSREIPLQVVRYVRDRSEGATDTYRDIMKVRNEADVARDTMIDEMTRVSKAARRAKAIAAVLGETGDVEKIIQLAESVLRSVRDPDDSPHPPGHA